MAALTRMNKLPLEVLECVVSYLSSKDLSRCCTVCKSWHEVFSEDVFWKKHCNKKLSVYLESASCVVEPYFTTPDGTSILAPVSGWRLCFLREQHYLKNLRSGRYKIKEVDMCFDNPLTFEFIDNDHVFLHTFFETQVWNVNKEPSFVMNIAFQLAGVWQKNLFKFHENKLIVVQCNVVQIFNVCLLSKTWDFHSTFFLDKPEEFSRNITKDSDVNEMFKKTSYDVKEDVQRVVCGHFLIGIVTTKTSLQNPVMHIWDLNSGKKIKEENCSKYFGSDTTHIYLETASTSQDKIIITLSKNDKKCFVMYSLADLKFLASHQCLNGDSLLCKGDLCISDYSSGEILRYNLVTNVAESVYKFEQGRLNFCWQVICDNIVVANMNDLILINPLSKNVEVHTCCDFEPERFEVIKDKYIALHDIEENMRELLEYKTVDNLTRYTPNTSLKLLFPLPPDIGSYRATNDVCTKMILELGNQVFVIHFW